MNSFVVSNCVYDGTSGDPNPICQVIGTVNSRNVYALTFFRFLMAASAADQMQEALTAVMFNFYAGVYYYLVTPPWPNLIPYPEFPASAAVAVHSEGLYPVASIFVTQGRSYRRDLTAITAVRIRICLFGWCFEFR
jgi:hypothetical protein